MCHMARLCENQSCMNVPNDFSQKGSLVIFRTGKDAMTKKNQRQNLHFFLPISDMYLHSR